MSDDDFFVLPGESLAKYRGGAEPQGEDFDDEVEESRRGEPEACRRDRAGDGSGTEAEAEASGGWPSRSRRSEVAGAAVEVPEAAPGGRGDRGRKPQPKRLKSRSEAAAAGEPRVRRTSKQHRPVRPAAEERGDGEIVGSSRWKRPPKPVETSGGAEGRRAAKPRKAAKRVEPSEASRSRSWKRKVPSRRAFPPV